MCKFLRTHLAFGYHKPRHSPWQRTQTSSDKIPLYLEQNKKHGIHLSAAVSQTYPGKAQGFESEQGIVNFKSYTAVDGR